MRGNQGPFQVCQITKLVLRTTYLDTRLLKSSITVIQRTDRELRIFLEEKSFASGSGNLSVMVIGRKNRKGKKSTEVGGEEE